MHCEQNSWQMVTAHKKLCSSIFLQYFFVLGNGGCAAVVHVYIRLIHHQLQNLRNYWQQNWDISCNNELRTVIDEILNNNTQRSLSFQYIEKWFRFAIFSLGFFRFIISFQTQVDKRVDIQLLLLLLFLFCSKVKSLKKGKIYFFFLGVMLLFSVYESYLCLISEFSSLKSWRKQCLMCLKCLIYGSWNK